jgi:hypothetical protein
MKKSDYSQNINVLKRYKASPVFAVSFVLIILVLVLTGCSSAPEEQLPTITPWERPKISTDEIPLAASEPDTDGVQLLNIGMVEDGAMIIVNFKGPAKLVDKWNQGSIFLVDEATGTAFDQIAVAPVIGPLFAKPKEDGQSGYAMLNNPGYGIRPGMTVTAVLGKYKREHVVVTK